ncbi:MAG TPA: tetratricopeptide repeat protein [Vicinamibacterales bacterium]|nr:tetratricopeptide repeat protein [Vicinamibacterales bacterium]
MQHLLIVGGRRAGRVRRADAEPASRRIDDLERAMPFRQAGGVRLVLTQPAYVLQALLDDLEPGERIVATADAGALAACTPDFDARPGPWQAFVVTPVGPGESADAGVAALPEAGDAVRRWTAEPLVLGVPPAMRAGGAWHARLAAAFEQDDPRARLAACRAAARDAPESALAWIALGSAARENGDAAEARGAFDRALALAPDWAAAQYEDGKFWLAADDMARASERFRRATDLMPRFVTALVNLGATLGELDDPEEALAALERARALEPDNPAVLSNVGVVLRELGRLSESDAVLARVVSLAPDFVFGHYNLGHTRFLAEDYAGAVAAYEEGRRRDPGRSPRQAARLALARFASGDADAAERELWAAADAAPAAEREDLLLEAAEIAHALLAAHPSLAPHHAFLDRIAGRIAALATRADDAD